MYFLRCSELKEKLSKRTLSEREALPYLIADSVLIAIAMSSFLGGYTSPNLWDFLRDVLAVMTTVAGIIYAYKKNGGNNGYDFLQKYIVLGWVITWRWILIFIPLFFIFYMLFGDHESSSSTPLEIAFIFIAEIILYWRIGKHVSDTAKG